MSWRKYFSKNVRTCNIHNIRSRRIKGLDEKLAFNIWEIGEREEEK